MAYRKKTWTEKLYDDKDLPSVVHVSDKMAGKWGTKRGDTCVIPAPREVDALMKTVPRGRVVTIHELRTVLAKEHGATIACPMCTGIFAWIAAHAAEEMAATREVTARGKSGKITPYWRTLKAGGELNAKFPGGVAALAHKLRAEGHAVRRRGKRYFVANFEKVLVAPQVRAC